MRAKLPLGHRGPESAESFTVFMIAACIVGVVTGALAMAFKLSLEWVGHRRAIALEWSERHGVAGVVVIIFAGALMTAAAAWLVRRVEPAAEGSGIPRVEAVVTKRGTIGHFRLLPVKFVGGVLSIGSGLALGREGPSVQMGGNVAMMISRALRRNDADMRTLIASGAAAGLAATFNAPIAGGVFVLEELLKRFDARTTLATLMASASAFGVAQFFLHGDEFRVPDLATPSLKHIPAYALLGVLAGLLGALYNKAVMASLRFVDGSKIPAEVRAGIIGASVACVALVSPYLVGGGDPITQDALSGNQTVTALLIILGVRFVLGVVSYAACTPGGLFAPMLVMGSSLGLVIGLIGQQLVPEVFPEPQALALVGMAAFFAATVRAPLTGIILATEMTGSVTVLPPMLGACAVAVFVAMVVRSAPIYDALAQRSEQAEAAAAREGKPGGPLVGRSTAPTV
ncbi:H(+)/Cl(-) exchange transporter ClcA [Corynebacterium aquilae]|uniref:H(+)/Cl(-) exchange transporter ClcA n=1 Tax=Corynebacterium aquilae TaxID=203263 RepID=UPI000950C891|nr:H(+)/Cl(-) exchange transporter ClcA [Corynebacterium aquilae]